MPLVFAGSVAFLFHLPQESQPVVSQGDYQDNSGVHVEALGVCSIDQKDLACWDLDGTNSGPLTEKVRAMLSEKDAGPLDIRFGMKNRFLAFTANLPPGYSLTATCSGNEHAGATLWSGLISSAARPILTPLLSEPSAERTDVSFSIGGYSVGKPTIGRFGRNSTIALADGPFKILDWETGTRGWPMFSDSFGYGASQSNVWRVFVSESSDQNKFEYKVTCLDGSGHPIVGVDSNGRPSHLAVTSPAFVPPMGFSGGVGGAQAKPNKSNKPQKPPETIRAASFERSWVFGTGIRPFETNIDPAYIRQVQITVLGHKEVLMKGIPLDSKA